MTSPAVESLLDFTGRVALVTGAGTGIGAGIARRFAAAGADVVVSYRSSAVGAKAVRDDIIALGRRAVAMRADVTHADQVEALLDHTFNAFGQLDVVVNNAGIYPIAGLTEMTEDDWDHTLAANLKSVFLLTRGAGKRMMEQAASGAIINIASIEATYPAPLHSHYSAAKAGVLMHTRSAALELGPHGIRVNSVSPGLIGRPGIEDDWPDGVERWRAAAPLTRLGHPDDVADACLFLASAGARWITGTDLRVDGGVTTHPIF